MGYESDVMRVLGKNIRDLNDKMSVIKDSNYLKTIELIINILEKGYCNDTDKIKYEQLLQKYMTPEISFNILNRNKQR